VTALPLPGDTAADVRLHSAARRVLATLAWLLALAVLLVAAAVAVSHLLGWRLVVADASRSGSIEIGSLAAFGPIQPASLRRGDIVRFTSPETGNATIRVVTAFSADGSSVVTRPAASAPADAANVPVAAIQQRFLFAVPLVGYVWPDSPVVLALVLACLALCGVILLAANARGRPPHGRQRIRKSFHAGMPQPVAWEGIVTQPHRDDESYSVRFPLRRQRSNEFDPSELPSAPLSGQLAVAAPAEPAEPAVVPEVREPIPFPPAPTGAKESDPLSPVQPSPLFTIPLRGQSTGSDARSERLIRQVRGEVEQLRQTLSQLSSGQDEMLHVDAEGVAANPEAALLLPPAVLVRTIIAAHQQGLALEARRARQARRLAKLQARLRGHEVADAETRGRLATLEQVIAALHANLEDLRLDRDRTRTIAPARSAPSLPPGGDSGASAPGDA